MSIGGSRFAAVAALVLASALPAGARGPCTVALEPLRDEVRSRIILVGAPDSPAERRERRSLLRIERRLGRNSRTPAKDLATLRRAGDLLVGLYPADSQIPLLLDAALDGLHADLALDREDLLLTARRLPSGEGRDRALDGAAEVAAALDADDQAPGTDHALRSGVLEGAARALDRTWRAVLDRRDRRARGPCGDLFTAREGGELLWRATRLSVVHQASSATVHVLAERRRRPADDSELFFEVRNFHGVGSYPIVHESSRWREGPFTYFRIVESGTLTVTAHDAAAGRLEGTFSFTVRGCVFGCTTFEVTDGAIATQRLERL